MKKPTLAWVFVFGRLPDCILQRAVAARKSANARITRDTGRKRCHNRSFAIFPGNIGNGRTARLEVQPGRQRRAILFRTIREIAGTPTFDARCASPESLPMNHADS